MFGLGYLVVHCPVPFVLYNRQNIVPDSCCESWNW